MSALKESGPGQPPFEAQEAIEATLGLVGASKPMFGEQFNPSEVGGMMLTPDGQVMEVRHPYWTKDESSAEADLASRVTLFPIYVEEHDDGSREFVWMGEDYDPANPTLGAEREISIMFGGNHYEISPDGATIVYPDGDTETMKSHGFDPEAIKQMVEHGVDISHGYEQLAANTIMSHARTEAWMIERGLNTPNLSVYPDEYDSKDWSDHWFVQRMPLIFETYGSAKEFGVMSHQLHVQIGDPEAAQHASNRYQGVQAVFSYLTSSAPIRDGSFETTIGDHYELARQDVRTSPDLENTEVFSPFIDHTHVHDQESGFHAPTILQDDLLAKYYSHKPYDWRELSRLGSPSSGAYIRPAPANMEEFFRNADEAHKGPRLVSSVRAMGMHSDRHRYEYGTVEFMNLGTSGGNIRKQLAVNEVVGKFFTAHHEEYLNMSDIERQQAAENYQLDCDEGHANNIFMALSGSETKFVNEGKAHKPKELMQKIIDYTNKHSPVQISEQAVEEVMATMEEDFVPEDPSVENSRMVPRWQVEFKDKSPSSIFTAFFSPNSPMTATEALQFAHEQHPELSTDEIMTIFSECRRVQVYEVLEEHDYAAREKTYLDSQVELQEEHLAAQVDEVFADMGNLAVVGAKSETED